ncbi:alpha/beta fold hydrolase [Mycobacterium sp. NPDC003449]
MTASDLEYSALPDRAAEVLTDFMPDEARVAARVAEFRDVQPRAVDEEGDVEVLDGVTFTHHFVDAPGDQEAVRFHYVEAGEGEPIVFLHGIPESWYEWHHEMAALAGEYRCIAFDLKGYGQSEKSPGDYRHEAAGEQLLAALDVIGIDRFNVVTHDRGTCQADFIAANHPDRVLRYGRGEQHLYHFHPSLAPQGQLFADSPFSGMMLDKTHFVVWAYTWLTMRPVSDADMRRIIQEYSFEDIEKAVPRYFNSSTFRQEWIERRNRLLDSWKCPVMVMQGYDSKTQPREFYEQARDYIPNAPEVLVRYIDAGHFWPIEAPDQVTALIRELLAIDVTGAH